MQCDHGAIVRVFWQNQSAARLYLSFITLSILSFAFNSAAGATRAAPAQEAGASAAIATFSSSTNGSTERCGR